MSAFETALSTPPTGGFSAAEAIAVSETTDAPWSLSTPYTVAVGDTFSGTLSTTSDKDIIALTVVAGATYSIDVTATGGGLDTYLEIWDANSGFVTLNDDRGLGTNAGVTLTFAASGTYYLDIQSFQGGTSGNYQVSVTNGTPLPVYSYDQIAAQLTSGYWTGKGELSRHFNVSAGGTLTVNITGLNVDGQSLATSALEAWSNVTGINFNFVTGAADITFDDNQAGAATTSNTSGHIINSSSVVISSSWLVSNGTTLDSYSFQTYIHEIGHALGLGHGGNYNGTAYYGTDNHYQNDSWQASIMSYMDQVNNTAVDATSATVVTPMMADIIAIKSLYGANTAQRTGNTVYGENSTAGGYLDQLINATNPVTFTIMDDGGNDTIDFGTATADQIVDLHAKAFSSVGGVVNNMAIARGTVIENFISGAGADTIVGNAAANRIWGGGGRDVISGGGLRDRLFGENGNDRLSGNSGDDILNGGRGRDVLRGGGGNDTMTGGRGNDHYIGGGGSDAFVFKGTVINHDKVVDFADNIDTLRIDNALWGNGVLSVAQVLTTYAVDTGTDVVFDFGAGNVITVAGIGGAGTGLLLNDIQIV